jgi:hypothetical protein
MSGWDGRRSNYYGARSGSEDELCWNCELAFTLNSAPANAVMHFCSPDCEQEWWGNQPLANLIEKRRRRKHSTE